MVPPNYPARLMLLPIWNLELAIHWTATEMHTLDLRPGLGAIEVPTLVLAGVDDPQYPLASIEEVIEGLRDVARRSAIRARATRSSATRPQSLEAVRRFVA